MWDVKTGQLEGTLEGHKGRVHSVAWDSGGVRLASGSDDGTVRVWDATVGRLERVMAGHTDSVASVA